jgi:glycine/D-amino acid oxidase-like deaminating enzyme
MKYDFAIVGQGLAGSVLAFELEKRGKTFKIFNDKNQTSSSAVAGGMYNPITGKFLAKTWLKDEIFPVMKNFFAEFDIKFNCKTYNPTQLIRPFVNENQKENFLNLIQKHGHQQDFDILNESISLGSCIENKLGSLLSLDAGWIDIPLFLAISEKYFESKQTIEFINFDYGKIQTLDNIISFNDDEFEKMIFCEGFFAKNNPFFNWLPFNAVKGETLMVDFDKPYEITEIVNGGAWIIPLSNNKARIGATYSWHELDSIPSQKAKEELILKTSKFLKTPYKITNQLAGVRPATIDRRPFIGAHPKIKNMFVFNGLGTKGVSLAPYFATELIEFIENKKEISAEANIERFYTLY